MRHSGLVFCSPTPVGSATPSSTILDKSRYKNNSSANITSWVRLPSGLWVIGGGNYYLATFPATITGHLGSSLSLLCWFNVTEATGYGKTIVGRYSHSGRNGSYSLQVPDSMTGLSFQNRSYTTGNSCAINATFTDWNKWTFVAVTLSPTGPLATIYINGVSANTQSGASWDCYQDGDWYICADSSWHPTTQSQLISHVKIYDHPLTPAQVWQIYQNDRRWFGV